MVIRALLNVHQPISRPAVPPSANPSTAEPSPDRRNCRRVHVSSRIAVSCRDAENKERWLDTRCLNMSRQGALVLSSEPFSVGTTVYISVGVLARTGSATIRHCTAHGSKFLIGLEFIELLTPDYPGTPRVV